MDDEAPGRARAEYAAASTQRRRDEKARIKVANQEMTTRLLAIKSKTDDGDGLIGGGAVVLAPGAKTAVAVRARSKSPPRDEMGAMRDLMRDKELDRIKRENKVQAERLANIKPTVDDDTEDDATGEARAAAKAASDKRRKEEAAALKAANAKFFRSVKKVGAVTDNKIWDDGEGSAGAMRSVVAAQSKARKAEEARQLEERNAEFQKSLSQVHSAVDDGDGHQF